ncbi:MULTISPECIES: universal stress protein [Micrococcaceae]|uniref:universal stress protein n=1 Tax=Micrococcaceae TaxID=1268 RepID=UPI000DCCFC4F|nr:MULTISPECIES: universal stress protein [Micrococcaceae]MDQ0092398.1 nucleotide-binding universal stress UspA family protein [Paeniglutamicibacter psychrophenolicus]RAX48693.1 universal stress protein [Arthrobacter sp. AQ5-05]
MDETTAGGNLPILVGVDGSPESVLALRWAKKLAGRLGVGIKAVSVWHLDMFFGPFSISAHDGETIMREVLKDALAEAFGDDPPEGLVEECRTGRPSEILLEESESAQMLIVGSRGHGGFAGLLLGSVSSSCAAHASCPVLVVRPAAKALESPGEDNTDAAKRSSGEPADGS